MEQTSKLSIVVNTQTAQKQLADFRANLRLVERSGQDMDKSLSKIGSKTQFAGLEASIKNLYKTMNNAGNSVNSFSKVIDNARALSDATRVITKSINDLNATKSKSSKSNGLGSSLADAEKKALTLSTSIESLQKKFNSLNTTLGISRKELGSFGGAALATKTNITLLGDALKINSTNIGALNTKIVSVSSSTKNLGSAAAAAKARANELANAYRLVNTGLQSNAQYLQQANKAMAANSSAAIAAKLNQDKLAISSSKVATAASNAAAASTKAQIAVANLAAASSRADAELSGAAAAAAKVSAANSNAAAAATRATGATVNLAAANSRAAAASSGAAAAASRATGATSSAAAAASRAAAAVTAEAAALSRAASAASNAAGAQDRASIAAIRLAAAEARAAADADRLAGGLGRANTQSRGLMGSINSLQGALAGGLFAVTGLGVLKTADEMQNLNSQVKLATKSNEEYLLIRQKVGEIADKNFSAIAATTNLYQNSARALANLGKSQQDVLVFTDAVSLAMRTGGRSTQEQASAILQLSQSMSSNILAGDEFRSLAENAPILLELVAKRMGVLPGQLKQLASDGKITGEIIYDALSQNIGMLEEMAKKMPLTMSQAFTVAKNRYKSYVNDMMNETGGMSGKIASAINDISANFETLTKVAVAGAGLAFANMALSIGSASTAMAIFNAVASLNPLILIAGGFLAVTSAIYGTNEVLDISGIMVGDFFDQMEIMIGDAGSQWEDFEATVARVMGNNTDVIADANDKNSKNFLGFYNRTEEGFAGVIQGISTGVFSLTNVFMSALTVIDNFILNTNSLLGNLGTGIYNAGQRAKGFFGGEDNSRDYAPYAAKDTNFLSVYADTFAKGQDSIRDYAQSLNKRALPKARAGEYDPNYVAPIRSGLLKNNFSGILQGGQGVLANRPAGLPDILRNNQPSTLPMDVEKLRQKVQLDELNALEDRKKTNDKLAKAQAKADKANGIKNLGNGFVSNTNLKGLPLKGGQGGQAVAGGKTRGYTAEFAQIANSGLGGDIKYFSAFNDKYHAGTTSKHANGSAFDLVLKDPKQAVAAANAMHKYADEYGYTVKILDEYASPSKNATGGHLHVSVTGRKKGSIAGGVDLAYMKQIASEQNKIANETEKAAEEARKEQERISKLRLDGMKEYGTKELQLSIENDERIAKIKESQYDAKTEEAYIAQSNERMQRELDVYKKGLDDKVSAFSAYQKTQRDLLKDEYNNDVFGIVTDPDLSRPENSEQLKAAILGAKALNDYKVSLYEQSLEQEKSAMYAFQKTERQILLDEGVARLADAKLKTDELRDYRIEAIEKEEAYKLSVFDTNQDLKMLELKKSHMTEMEYILAEYGLRKKLIAGSNDPDDVKRQNDNNARAPIGDSITEMMAGFAGPENPYIQLDTLYADNLEKISAYEASIGAIEGSARTERLAAEKSYQEARRDLIINSGENIFGSVASMARDAFGEQSTIFRAMFAVEKGFAIARSVIAIQTALASAAASLPFPANLPVMATVAAEGATILSSIKAVSGGGFKDGGYTGNMGVNQVAGAVHGQEYVFDAQSTKRIGVNNLEAMRSGRAANDSGSGVGEVNITVNVDANGNSSMTGEQSNAMGKRMAEGIKALIVNEVQSMTRPQALLDRQYARR